MADKKIQLLIVALGYFLMSVLASSGAHATYRNRISLMPGMVKLYNKEKMNVEFGFEMEHRLRRWIGIGAIGNYVLSHPPTTLIGAPEFFLHPYDGNGFFSVAPLMQFQSGATTKFGVRVGTRFLIPMWLLRIGPVIDYDFIGGGHQYVIGVGLEIHTI